MRRKVQKRSGLAQQAVIIATGVPWTVRPRALLTCLTPCRCQACTAQPVAEALPLSTKTAMASQLQGVWPGP